MRIELRTVSYCYNQGWPDEVHALRNANATLQSGEIVAILGREGSGKSTLLQHVNGLLFPGSGEVRVDGETVTRIRATSLRSRIGMVFQYPEHQLFAATVFDDVAFAVRRRGVEEAEVARQVGEVAAIVGLDLVHLGKRRPFELSGGERRRVAIAGALVNRPDLMLLDEPFAALDPLSRRELASALRRLRDEWGTGIALVSHSLEEALPLADRTIVLHRGEVVFDGTPESLLRERRGLEQWGLKLPVTVRFVEMLRERGIEMPEGIWRVEDVVAAILNS